MKLPLIHVPVSRKLLLGALAGAVGAGLQAVGLYHVPADVQGWISTGEFLLVGYGVPEGVKFLNWAAKRAGLPVDFDEEA